MPNQDGWSEASIAWGLCALLHDHYAKRQPYFKAKQREYKKRAEHARMMMNKKKTIVRKPFR
jgi:hypothetical protein